MFILMDIQAVLYMYLKSKTECLKLIIHQICQWYVYSLDCA